MATNPYVNKVVYGNQTVMDISDTDAQESDVVAGKTFYKGNGQRSSGTADYYSTADSAETAIDDADYFPYYDSSASSKRKSLWSNIKSVLKTYFDTLYKGINAHDAWSDVTSKPFETLSSFFTVTNGQLKSCGNLSSRIYKQTSNGSASSAGGRGVSTSYYEADGSYHGTYIYLMYVMKQTDNATSYVFTDSTYIKNDILVDVYSSIYGESPTNVVVDGTAHTVTVTFAEAKSREVAIVFL